MTPTLKARLHALTDQQQARVLMYLVGRYEASESQAAKEFREKLKDGVEWQERSTGSQSKGHQEENNHVAD